ncbi:hypothetical protein AHMF7605_01760 [Adhaeribacter arboris]|uniref:Uncharacterized protein n=1 Tax=Adhaeribacter arboris TaxID=2072846 RepID=A0A2T2YA25_9BACT|nr:contractile injection system tape measure protein [Adhaeribacter arboris]PSR52336.1 hypothetical protein AHMF7605_01760 [Adhaeribacter arboris]
MQTIAINKEIFEFTCSQEEIAKRVRQEFVNYVAPQLHELVSKIITEQLQGQNSLRIDKIEIDLGDVCWPEFGEAEMLQKFEQDFTQQIARFQNQPVSDLALANAAKNAVQSELDRERPHQAFDSEKLNYYYSTNPTSVSPSGFSHSLTSIWVDDWELVQTFLTKGILPWWAEQVKPTEIDKAIQRLINYQPQLFHNFLSQQQPDAGVWQRLATHVKPATQTLLQELFAAHEQPVPVPIFKKSQVQKAGFPIPILNFTKEQLTKLKTFFQRLPFVSTDTRKARSLRKIMQLNGLNWIQQAALFDWLPEAEFKTIQLYFRPENRTENWVDRPNVEAALRLLTPVQMEFLLNPAISTDISTYYESKELFNQTPSLNDPEPESYPNPELPQNEDNSHLPAEVVKNTFPTSEEGNPNNLSPVPDKSTPDSPLMDNAPDPRTKNLDAFSTKNEPNSTLNIKEHGFSNQTQETIRQKMNIVPDWEISLKTAVKSKAIVKRLLLYQPLAELKNGNNFRVLAQEKAAFQKEVAGEELAILAAEKEEEKANFDQLIRKFYPAKSATPFAENQAAEKSQHIISVLQNLSLSSQVISRWLQQLSLPELQQLQATVTKTIVPTRERGKLIQHLINHPYLLQYNLVSVLASISTAYTSVVNVTGKSTTDFTGNSAISAEKEPFTLDAAAPAPPFRNYTGEKDPENQLDVLHRQLVQVVNNLSRKEAVIMQHILSKAAWQTQSEKSSLQRFMAKLPTESLLFLRALTDLPEAELQQLTTNTPALSHFSPPSKEQEHQTESPEETTGKIYVENAGLCLLAPYLPSVFNRLHYLEKQQFKNSYVATRALQVTQYLVTGKRRNPEYVLAFNKLLCNVKSDVALSGGIQLTKKEISEANDLLESLIEHWQALKSTSPQGFRESFLQRKGILTESSTRWTLQVERKGHDLLLNTIPWGFTLIRLPWMKKALQVEW